MTAAAAVIVGRGTGTVVKAAECSSESAIAMTSGVTMRGAGATCAMEGGTVVKAADGAVAAGTMGQDGA